MAVRVFLVEDLENVQVLLRELLRTVPGLEVVGTAVDEGRARAWLDANPEGWDVAIVDLVLGQGSGFGVISRASRAPRQVVVFSSYVTDNIRAHCERLGATAVFDKADSQGLIDWLRRLPR
ncbi:MAG TPA: response regulator [Ramlibacter sp.]|nr:response regulator [Ramlibacter sp.]